MKVTKITINKKLKLKSKKIFKKNTYIIKKTE